jgi:oligoendopeptidase F
MCVARTARRRRKQAANNYAHMAPMDRPRYRKVVKKNAGKRLLAARARGFKG